MDKDGPSRDSWLIDPKSVDNSTLLRSADNGYSYDAFSDDPTAVQSEVWDGVKEWPDQRSVVGFLYTWYDATECEAVATICPDGLQPCRASFLLTP
jgi:hypothetical protein